MLRSHNIQSERVDLDDFTFRQLVSGQKSLNVWTVHIQNALDLSNMMNFLRVNMRVSFGIGPNDSVYIIDHSAPANVEIQYFNLPLSISYNEYLDEVRIVEYYSDVKYEELDKLVRGSLMTMEKSVSTLSDDISEDSDKKWDFIQYLLNDSEQPYIHLSIWLRKAKKTEKNAELYDKLHAVWIKVMGAYAPTVSNYTTSAQSI